MRNFSQRIFGSKTSILILIVLAFALGFILRGGCSEKDIRQIHEHIAESETEFWICSMHPNIRQPKPGKCPICGMDLIPVSTGDTEVEEGARELKLSKRAMKLAEIQAAPVERKFVEAEIRMVGKVDYDETRVGYITAWVPGRIDRIYVDYTGIPVKKGDHMVYLYSPELLTAQEELLQSINALRKLKRSAIKSIMETARATVDSAREKLRLLGLTKEQIANIEKRGRPSDHITIYSPMSGIVIHKNALEGMYVKTGERIYTIADLSRVWVRLDAYESDLAWIRYGQEVEFRTEAYPGRIFKGKISFIDPVLNPRTRTVKVRVNVPNPDGILKPEMFVRAVVNSRVAAGGKIMDASLSGKWICPMHPEIVKDGSGSCDTCGMPLVRAESLGYVSDVIEKPPLVISATAPLITGKRAVVYIKVPGKEGTYEGREVILGPRAGEHYIVKEGLNEGELIVVNGNFKIDSALQILAKPSMMNPEGGAPMPGHHHTEGRDTRGPSTLQQGSGQAPSMDSGQAGSGQAQKEVRIKKEDIPATFKIQLDNVLSAYFVIHQALSRDRFKEALSGARNLVPALRSVDMGLLEGEAHMEWMKEQRNIMKSADHIKGAKDITKAREGFALLSESMIAVVKRFGARDNRQVIRFHCPMAFNNRGADWLSGKDEVENPYFGEAMFRCGERVEW